MAYRPSAFVMTVRTLSINTSLAACTVAPATTAPEVSFTTPDIVLWAEANAGHSKRTTSAARAYKENLAFVIPLLPLVDFYFRLRSPLTDDLPDTSRSLPT